MEGGYGSFKKEKEYEDDYFHFSLFLKLL